MEPQKDIGRRVLGAIGAVVIGVVASTLVYLAVFMVGSVFMAGFRGWLAGASANVSALVLTGYLFYLWVERNVWWAAAFVVLIFIVPAMLLR